MLIEFFLERSRIELTNDGLSFRGRVLDLPEIDVTAATPEQCRAKLEEAVSNLLVREASRSAQNSATGSADGELTRTGQIAAALAESSDLDGATEEPKANLSSRPEFTDIIYEKKDWIARVTINRPTAYNAYTSHTLGEMTAAFRDAAGDSGVAALVLTGAGDRAFCAGGDVQQHGEEHVGNPAAVLEWMDALFDAHTALRQMGKPSIARINGMVAGGGNDWNLACDLAIAADHAKFVQMETKVGLASAGGAAHWLPLLVGERRAREIFLTAEPVSASKALLWGLVNDVVPYRQLDKAVDALCRKLIDRFPESTRLVREQLGFWKDLRWDSMIEESRDRLAAQFAGEEAREGLRALAEKREVDYAAYRLNALAQQLPVRKGAASVGDQTVTRGSRSCYSCGARDLPARFERCGFCGTRLV